MSANPLFSIVTVCLNEKRLDETCKSIVNQTYQNFEWIIIDGGSEKSIIDIFSKYRNRIDYFISEKDGGVYDAMNKGIYNAHGKYINFMNAGDEFSYPYILDDAKYVLNNNEDVDVLYGEAYCLRGNDHYISCTPDSSNPKFLIEIPIMHQAAFIKRGCFCEYGNYDLNYKIVADWCFFVNLYMSKRKFLRWNMIVANYATPGISSNVNLDSIERNSFLKNFFPHILNQRHQKVAMELRQRYMKKSNDRLI